MFEKIRAQFQIGKVDVQQNAFDGRGFTFELKDAEGNVIEQSAFLYNGHTKTLAAYARGFDAANEANIYEEVQRRFISELKTNSVENVFSGIYTAIERYLK